MNSKLDTTLQAVREDIEAVKSWTDELYESQFAQYFTPQRNLYKSLQDTRHPITDSELEEILTAVPLNLFSCSEAINDLRLHQEVLKLKIKEREYEIENDESLQHLTQTKRKEMAAQDGLENKLLSAVLGNLISRVEHECSFSKELVMSAKKIWDSRRGAETAAGVYSSGSAEPESTDDLPEYSQSSLPKTYIK